MIDMTAGFVQLFAVLIVADLGVYLFKEIRS